jgi:lipid-A-disaccharide synthase
MSRTVEEVLVRLATEPRLRRVRGEQRRSELASCALAWAASGTATLECALLDVPMVVGYRLQALTYFIARMLVRVPHVALANLIARRRAFPELIQGRWNAAELAQVTRQMLTETLPRTRSDLATIRKRLGDPGASRRAAEAVLEHLARV